MPESTSGPELRTLHVLPGHPDPQGLAATLAPVRAADGCLAAELYESCTGASHLVLTTQWASETAFSAWWTAVEQSGGDLVETLLAGEVTHEIYPRSEQFLPRDGVWRREVDSVISWPAGGGVRILIEYAVIPDEQTYAVIAREVPQTLRETGCEFYDWLRNVELADHLLLVELWSDQEIYDLHNELRNVTVDYRGPSHRQPTESTRGRTSREFYRRHAYRPLYGRWLPASEAEQSIGVSWGPA